MNNCTSCGASFKGDPYAKSWKCTYCGQINYNKEFLQRYIQTVNTAHVSNLMQVAIISYQSHEFSNSLSAFEKVLQEDSNNLDAWVYAALSAAQTINLTNFDTIIPKVKSFLQEAEKIGSDSDVYLVGKNDANELICSALLRGAQMRFEEAKKVGFAYNSVDDGYAKSKANEQIRLMISYIEAAMRLPINNPALQCEVASVAIQGIKFYAGQSPYSELLDKAKSTILGFKDRNPSLFQKYANLLTGQSRSKQGCSPKVLLIVVGSFFVLCIIIGLLSDNTQIEKNQEVSPAKKSPANLQQNLSTPNTAIGTQNQPTQPENVQTITQPLQEKILPSPCIAAIDKIEVGILINPDGSIINPGNRFASTIGKIEIAAYISSGKVGQHVNAILYFDSESRKISNPVQKIISEDGDSILPFSLSPFYGHWPTGNYRVVISIEENGTSKEITYVIIDSETKEKEEINKIYQGASQSGEGYTSLPLSKPTAAETVRGPKSVPFTNQQMQRNAVNRDINSTRNPPDYISDMINEVKSKFDLESK